MLPFRWKRSQFVEGWRLYAGTVFAYTHSLGKTYLLAEVNRYEDGHRVVCWRVSYRREEQMVVLGGFYKTPRDARRAAMVMVLEALAHSAAARLGDDSL